MLLQNNSGDLSRTAGIGRVIGKRWGSSLQRRGEVGRPVALFDRKQSAFAHLVGSSFGLNRIFRPSGRSRLTQAKLYRYESVSFIDNGGPKRPS